MAWLKDVWLIVATLPVKTKTIFVFTVVVLTASYFFLDRILDYKAEMVRLSPASVDNRTASFYELGNEPINEVSNKLRQKPSDENRR